MASSSSTTTVAAFNFVQMMAVCAERHNERWLLSRHYMFMDDDMVIYLIQSGLVDKIVNVFQAEHRKSRQLAAGNGQKRGFTEVDDDNNSTNASSHEGVTRKKLRRTNTIPAAVATQTEDSLMMASSSQSLVNPAPLSLTTTVLQAVDIYAFVAKKRYQSTLLAWHKMCLRKSDLCLLDHHGLLDQLVRVVEDFDRTTNNPLYRSIHGEESTAVQGNHGVSERAEEDEDSDDDDEDEDYEFELSSEDEEHDAETEIEPDEPSTMNKDMKEHEIVYIDASTQTADDSVHIINPM